MNNYPPVDTDLLSVQPEIPGFEWFNPPAEWVIEKGSMIITSEPETDFFRSPRESSRRTMPTSCFIRFLVTSPLKRT